MASFDTADITERVCCAEEFDAVIAGSVRGYVLRVYLIISTESCLTLI